MNWLLVVVFRALHYVERLLSTAAGSRLHSAPTSLWSPDNLHFLAVYTANIQFNMLTSSTFMFMFFHGAGFNSVSRPSLYPGFTITLRHATLSRTPLDK
jgi:hypothetical protein